jgi:hypothetical protein
MRLLWTLVGAIGAYLVVAGRNDPGLGDLALVALGTTVSWIFSDPALLGRRGAEAPRSRIRSELRRLFRFGAPTVYEVYEVLERAGEESWFEKEQRVTGRFLQGAMGEAEWVATMRRYLGLG